MNKKITFLKNPRSLSNTNNPKVGTMAIDNAFRVSPECVVFTEYNEGGVYEIPLSVTNVAGIMRRITVLPPTTANFSIGNIVYPQETHGSIAPGMALSLTIHFHADSPSEFDDFLTLKTENASFTVPLRARREPPKLTLVDVMECGTCWVGDRLDMVFKCRNLGGSAGFKFFHEVEEMDPSPGEEVLISGPYTIFPLQFYLAAGQSVDIYVCFQPQQEGEADEKIILACDN